MTQVITTPDGVEHEFPDGASDDVIKNALSSYSKNTGSTKTTPMPAAMTYDPNNPNAGWGDWALSKLHNFAVGGNEFNRVVQDSATFGGLDKAQSLVPGSPSVDQLRAQTEQSRKDIGPLAPVADVLGYAAGPGELKVGEGIGNLIGRGIVGRVGGSAAEGGGAAVLGTLGHGDTNIGDIGKAATVGGLIGGVTGALPGGAGERPTTPTTAALKDAKDTAFAPLHTTPVNAPRLDAAFNSVAPRSGANVNLSDTFKSKVADIGNEVTGTTSGLTAADVADYQRALWSKARNPFDQKVAGQYESALDGVVGPSTAYDIKAANAAHNTFKTSDELDKLVTNPSSAPAWLANRLAKKPALYQSQPGLFDALNAVAARAPSKEPSISGEVGKAIARHAIGAAAGGTAGYLLGNNPYGDVAGVALGALAPTALAKVQGGGIANRLLAAQHLNATGMKVDPSVYTSNWLRVPGILSRQAGYAAGASGAF